MTSYANFKEGEETMKDEEQQNIPQKPLTEKQQELASMKFEIINGILYYNGKRALSSEEVEQSVLQGLREYYEKHRRD